MIESSKVPPKRQPAMANPNRNEGYFDSSHLKKNMNRRVARSGTITLATQALKFTLRMGSAAVLARILTPSDFGLIASITVVTGVIEMFKDSGLSLATVQREQITHAQISTLFWINVGLSLIIMLIKFSLAPVLVWMYDEPRLFEITMVTAAFSVLGGMSVQHNALLQRRMEFGRLAFIEIFSIIAGIATAVTMGLQGYGYWALVGMTVGTAISSTVLTFTLSGWIPGLPVKGSGVKSMLRFGGNLAGASFFNYLTRNADNFIIALVQGPASLGIYSRAYSLFLMPMQQFLIPISRVVVPALSRLKTDPVKFREMVLEKSYFAAFFVILVTGFSFAAAPELVWIVLGPAWSEAVPIVRCLALGGAIYGTNVAGGWINSTLGRTERQLRVAMVAGPTYTIAFLIGVYINGAVGVACAFSITCLALRYPVFKYLLAGSPVSPKDLMRPLLTVGAPVCAASLLAIVAAGQMMTQHLGTVLAIKVLVFSVVIAVCCFTRILKIPKVNRAD